MKKLRVLDLFSGIGGFSLGLERTGGFETVAFCEIEEFPRRVLAKHWPEVPCFEDVRKLRGQDIDGTVDVICGGYPCQPFSTAGKRRGAEDDRHLWPEFSRLVAELRPTWVIGENVAGHISMGLDSVLSDLEGKGYACRTFVVPACAIDAPHRRDRCWIIGYSDSDSEPDGPVNAEAQGVSSMGDANGNGTNKRGVGQAICDQNRHSQTQERKRHELKPRPISSSDVADAPSQRQQGSGQPIQRGSPAAHGEGQADQLVAKRGYAVWPTEPNVGRVADGVPRRVDRLRALGNAVVPQIPEMIGHAILEAEREQA